MLEENIKQMQKEFRKIIKNYKKLEKLGWISNNAVSENVNWKEIESFLAAQARLLIQKAFKETRVETVEVRPKLEWYNLDHQTMEKSYTSCAYSVGVKDGRNVALQEVANRQTKYLGR